MYCYLMENWFIFICFNSNIRIIFVVVIIKLIGVVVNKGDWVLWELYISIDMCRNYV